MITRADIEQVVTNLGLSTLGIATPMLAVRWTTAGAPTTTPAEGAAGALSLINNTADTWIAPAAGLLTFIGGEDRLLMADGTTLPENTPVFRLYPQVYLRLVRLYSAVIEGQSTNTHKPMRPVPHYFAITDRIGAPVEGEYAASDDLGIAGTLTIHDERGLAIDPVAVAATFNAILQRFDVLEARELLTTTPTAQNDRQIFHIGQLGANETRIHFVNPYARPYDGSHLENLTEIFSDAGLFSIDDTGTAITIDSAGDPPDDLRISPATFGTLDSSLTIRAADVTLHRDFLRGLAVDLKPFLIGQRPTDDPAAVDNEVLPAVRHNEELSFSLNGNAALGVANTILSGSPSEQLVVSPVIESDFALPTDATDANAQWPNFPTTSSNTDPIPSALKDGFEPAAHFITGTEADVVLVMNGLAVGQAIRVYNRNFLPDAREGRGAGAGTVVSDASGRIALQLEDPLGLVVPGSSTTLPPEATLHVDVVIVNANKQARVFGNVTCAIGASAALSAEESSLLPTGSNNLDTIPERGISSAGILGLPAPPLPAGPFVTQESIVNLALALGSEGTPRDAPRLPTMARRETIVASANSGTWQGLTNGMYLIGDTRNAEQRLGSPGSPGGRPYQTVSIQTQGGLLAYDLARAALRRTRDIVNRLEELAGPGVIGTNWTPPIAATAGTISAAMLQTISPATETPELSLVAGDLASMPATWTDFVDLVVDSSIFSGLPSAIRTRLTNALNTLRTSPVGERLYAEFKQEFITSLHGRRDLLWAAMNAISGARELIYIEGPTLTQTGYDADLEHDLIDLIESRLNDSPGLRVVIAFSKELEYGPGYEVFAAREYAFRNLAVASLVAAAPQRVVAFHPMGFPGRPLRLNTNIVIVDDMWACIGSSTIRRRGLTFDGGLDVVFTDRTIENGRSLAIADLRRNLMAGHLGVSAPAVDAMPEAPWVRLKDGYQAFWTVKELLDQGGAGLIEPIWDGQVPGVPPIDTADFPNRDVADPDGRNFQTIVALIVAAISSAAGP